jgi:hypothetical protein
MDDDETTDFRGILGNLAAQPGGLLGGLFPPPPGYDPQQPGGLPPGADPTAISLAAAASASDLARTLRNIDHQAAIMAAFGKAMGAPGTRSADAPAQGGGPGPSVPAGTPDASTSGPGFAQRAPAQVAPAAPVNANTAFTRSSVPLPRPRPNMPQWPTPGVFDQRWPRLENSDASTVLQDTANAPLPRLSKSALENPDWSTLPRGVANVPAPGPNPGLINPDTRALLQDIADVPSQTPSKVDFPNLRQLRIDPDDLIRRIVRAENPSEDPNARATSTTATGLTQFTKGTWRDVLKRYRPDLYDFWSADPKETRLQALRTDPALSRQMAGAYADENVKALDGANIPVTYRNIYLAHFLGPRDATNLLRADPDTLARSVLSPGSVGANDGLITPTMTVRDLIQWGEDRMEHGAGWKRPAR